jgi:exonuclease SbcD
VARTLRIAHLADTHLGYRQYATVDPRTGRNQRSVDIERAYARTVDDILERDVDLVIHAGDMFHHTRPSWAAIRTFVEQTRRLVNAGLPFIAIAGNHDMPRLRSSESLFTILQLVLPSARIVAGYDLEEIPFPGLDLMVHAFPHGALTDPNAASPVPAPRQRNILVAHGLVQGMPLPSTHHREPGETELGMSLLGGELDYIALGHFHIHGLYAPKAYYSGATERVSWTDFDATPGYNLVTLNEMGAVVEHVDLPGRPMIRLDRLSAATGNAREVADRILSAASQRDQPEGMFRIVLDDADRPKRREVERLIRREGREFAWSLEVLSPRETLFAPREGTDEAESMDFTPLTLFEQFIAEKREQGEYTAGFATAFRERGVRALQDAAAAAEQKVAAEEASA